MIHNVQTWFYSSLAAHSLFTEFWAAPVLPTSVQGISVVFFSGPSWAPFVGQTPRQTQLQGISGAGGITGLFLGQTCFWQRSEEHARAARWARNTDLQAAGWGATSLWPMWDPQPKQARREQ